MDRIILAIQNVVNAAEKMKNAYFLAPPCNAAGRRSYERYNSAARVEWIENGNNYTAEYVVECSCKNVYARGVYTKNGVKTTLTAVKNSLKRLEKSAENG